MINKLFTLLFGLTFSLTILGQGPTHDPDFITGTGFGFGNRIECVVQDAAGNLLVGGATNSYQGQTISNFAKLHPDGSLDATFQSVMPNTAVLAIWPQPNGQIIIAGNFTTVSGVSANGIARINANGTVDANFCANIGIGANSSVRCLAVDGAGNIYAGGYFTSFGGLPYTSIVKLQSNGSIDPSFPPLNIDDAIFSMAFNSNGNLWIGGSFTTINSNPAPGISRLTPIGTVDASLTLTNGTTSGTIKSIALQSNGSLVVGGKFPQICGTLLNNICRLNANGSIDQAFMQGTGTDNPIDRVAIYSDDRIAIVGDFTTYNSQTRNCIARLLSDGSLDNSFDPLQGTFGRGSCAIIQPDKKIVAVGSFNSYMGNYAGAILRTLGELTILAQTSNTIVCKNSMVNLSVTSSNCSAANLTYQWYLNNNPLSGATSSVCSIPFAQTTNAGDYTCLVTSTSCGSIMSLPINVIVNTPPAFTSQPTGTTVCVGSTANLVVAATGSNLSYQWYRNSTPIVGEVTPAYSIASVSTTDASAYRCTISGSCGSLNSNYASLWVKSNTASISTTSVSFCNGGTLSGMTVGAGGLNPTYQWCFNGNPIIGATSLTYSKPNATAADAGLYSCQVTSACGVVMSNSVTAVVNQMPIITSQPISNTSVCQNGATFTIVITGGSIVYKWYKNGVLISGATSSSYTPPTGVVSHGNYYCVGSNACGSVNSNTVTYTMSTNDISITIQPIGVEYCTPGSGAVSVSATGSGPITYQWYNGTTAISGANAPTYNFTNLTQNTNFKCFVTNGCFSSMSSITTVTISPLITFIPKVASTTYISYTTAITNTVGSTSRVCSVVSLEEGSTLAGGIFTNVNGQAKKNIIALNSGGVIDNNFSVGGGSNGTIYDMAKQADGKILVVGSFYGINGSYQNGAYRFNANGTFDATFSANYGIGANPAGLISVAAQEDGKVLVGGGFTSFSGVSRRGIVRLNPDGSVDQSFGYSGSGATVGAVTYVNDIAIQKDDKIIIAGGFQSVNGVSKKFVARLNPDGSIDNTFNAGGIGPNNTVFACAVQNDGKIIIGGWFGQYNSQVRSGLTRLNSDGTPDPTFNAGTGTNYLVYGLTLQPDGKILATGSFTSFNGTQRKYIARINTDGTVDATFNPPAGGANNDGYSTCLNPDNSIVFGGQFSTYGGDAHLRIVKLYNEMNVYPQNPTVCSGSTIKLYVPNHEQNLTQVVWRKNGTIIATQTNSYSAPAIAANSGTYTVWLENACNSILLGTTTVSVVVPGSIVSSPGNVTACVGSNVSLSVATTGYVSGYQWFKGAIPVEGATGSSLMLTNVQTTATDNYRCKVSTACGTYYSGFGSITVNTCGGTQTGRMANIKNEESNNNAEFDLNVYPNPTNGFINIDCKDQAHYKAKIFTLQGKELLTNQFDQSTQLELKDIPAGMYLLSVYNADDYHLKTIRIIKE